MKETQREHTEKKSRILDITIYAIYMPLLWLYTYNTSRYIMIAQ